MKIGRQHWKESAVVESEQSLLARQSRKVQYASLYRGGVGGGGGQGREGTNLPAYTIKTSVKFRDFGKQSSLALEVLLSN